MQTLTKKSLLVPTVVTLVGLVILASLGTWQLQRRAWKLDLIDQIEKRTQAEPIALDEAVKHWRQTKDIDHTHIEATGKYDHTKERHLFTVENGQVGWRVFTPLTSVRAGTVFVDRGFVPDKLKDKAIRREGLTTGEVRITGLAREPSKKGYFTLDNQPQKNEFYWRSLAQMKQSVFEQQPKQFVPFFLELKTQEPTGGSWPKPQIQRLNVPNKHLEYALTWFGLAVTLLCVFAFYIRARLRET